MMKRLILSSILINTLCLSTVQAWNGGWLLGISTGYLETSGTLHSTISYLNPAGLPTALQNVNKDTDFVSNGLLLGGLVGYQVMNKNWLLGLEFNADWYSDNDETQNFALIANPLPGGLVNSGIGYQGTVSYDQDVGLGLTGRVGYAVSDRIIPYIRLGIEATHAHLDVDYLAPQGFNAGNTAFKGNNSDSHTNYHFLGGIGIEFPFCRLSTTNCVIRGTSVRAEYNYHGRGKSLEDEFKGVDSVNVPALSDHLYTSDYKPHMHSAKISLVWNFN